MFPCVSDGIIVSTYVQVEVKVNKSLESIVLLHVHQSTDQGRNQRLKSKQHFVRSVEAYIVKFYMIYNLLTVTVFSQTHSMN